MKNIILLFVLCFVQILFSQNNKKLDKLLEKWNKNQVPYISVNDVLSSKDSIILLDSREPKEFSVSHLKNATCVGYDHFDIESTLKKLPENKNTKIVVYCSLGIRSEKIAHQLIKRGYTNVFNLYGGIFEWKNNGFSIVDTTGNKTEKVHAFDKNWSKWLKKGEKVY